MERMPQIEKIVTPEKSREELYFETLKAKRDVLSSHYTLCQLRKGKKVEEMSEVDVEDYKAVKKEYDKRRELFLASFDNLNEDDGQKIAEFTSLAKVEIALSSLEKPAEAVIVAGAELQGTPAPESSDQQSVETPVNHGETIKSDRTKELERLLSEKYNRLHQDVSVIDRRPPEEEIRALEAERNQPEAELLERQEAEANPDRPTPKGFMQRLRDSYDKAKEAIMGANRISGGSETVESRMSPLGFRKEAIKPVSPGELVEPIQPEQVQPIQPEVQPQPEVMSQQTEKEPKKPSAWGWLKERGKGVWNFGIWEFHQAERFRSKTKEVANDTKNLTISIQQERNLSLEEAEKEAWETVEELKKNNLNISSPEFYQANKDITDRKRKENDEEIEYIIASSSNDLLDKLGKYRGEAGQDVLTQENKLAFQADLRGELSKMRDGAMRKDFINFAKLMRKNLDEKWWRRYVWGAAEAALGFIGVKYLVVSIEQAALAKLVAAEKAAGAVKGGAGAIEQVLTQKMHENIWTTLKEMAQNGPQHLNLDNSTLQELSQKVLDGNNMYEQEWVSQAAEGLRSSRALPEGLPINIPLDVMKVLGY